MDLATLVGVVSGGVLLVIGMSLSAPSLMIFVDLPSVFITFGGAIAATFITLPLSKLKLFMRVSKKAFQEDKKSPAELIDSLVKYAEIARRDGILALEGQTSEVKDEFLVKGIQLAVDGTDPEVINQTLSTELECLAERHGDGKKLYDTLSKLLPAWGLIGTLVGLVGMLAALDDPSQIGVGMSVALLTTLYGAVAMNYLTVPIGDKLAMRSKEEFQFKNIVIRGVMSIQSGDNPRIVAQKLRIFLPPDQRKPIEKA